MARHTIQIPINKSSNSRGRVIYDADYNLSYSFEVETVTNKLYSFGTSSYSDGATGFGLAWDSELIPENKQIVSAKLFLYSLNSHSQNIIYRYTDFSEGVAIPSRQPSDGSQGGHTSHGWNAIDIYPLKGNSVVIDGRFAMYRNSYGYFITDYWELYSHRNPTNKPYLEIVYDDIPPDKPTSLYPAGITVSTRDVIRFSWLHNTKENNNQKGFNLQYSTNGGTSWTTVNQTTPNQYYDMPANTLPASGNVTWRVRTIDDNDGVSEYSTANFTLGVVPQKAPIPISPISQYLDENKPVRFEWSFVGGSSNETQSKFDLQYSNNGGSSWTTKTVTTPETSYEVPANTFSGGNITWRVRTYNNWNEVSPYSENRSFTVIGSPPIPQIISISNSGRPTINWQSIDQHIYEIEVIKGNEVIFESGSIPSTSDRSFKLPIYLKDGNYLVKLRIYNEYNLFSNWAEKSLTIATIKPQKPIIEVFTGGYSVTIRSINQGPKNLIYRDNILIGQLENSIFKDFTGENDKEYKYFVRTVDSNDNFNDSDIKIAKCKFTGNTLALAELPGEFLQLKYGLDTIPKKSNSYNIQGTLQYFDGREYPIVEYSEFKSRSKTVFFILRHKEDLNNLINLIDKRKVLLFRDVDGDNVYGNILAVDYEKNILGFYEVGFTIIKTDYKGAYYD